MLHEWTDEQLAWNPADFDNIQQIVVPTEDVWTPDIVANEQLGCLTVILLHLLDFRVSSQAMLQGPQNVMRVNHTGHVHVQFSEILSIYCLLNVVDFPFDRQECNWTV